MAKNKEIFLGLILYFLLIINCFAQAETTITDIYSQQFDIDKDIVEQIDDIAKKSNSIIGVTAIHIETNQKVSYNGNKLFFMASTIKVPIALALMQRVDQRQESLDRVIHLTSEHSIPGSGSLSYMVNNKALDISLIRLLKLMLMVSDNTASDAILQQVNGPKAVYSMLNRFGFHAIFVKRSILQMYLDAHGADHSLLQQPHTSLSLEKSLNTITMPKRIIAWQFFQNDFRDTTTPDDMAQLLVSLYRGQLLSANSTQFLLRIMEKCRTGGSRIKGLLPAGTTVAHKTGTWSIYTKAFLMHSDSKQLYRFVSDVGIITLPNKKGHIAIAVYVKSTAVSDYNRTRVIAEVTRSIYDYFLNENI